MNHYGRQTCELARLGKRDLAKRQFAKYRAKIIDGQTRRIMNIKGKHGMAQA